MPFLLVAPTYLPCQGLSLGQNPRLLNKDYLFTSARLAFRNWQEDDLEPLLALNQDPEVMAYFPHLFGREETQNFIARMKKQLAKNNFCYFAVETLEDGEFIGITGIAEKDFEADFTPCVDIGWRLKKTVWGQGYATEGAQRCLDFGMNVLKLKSIKGIAPVVNTPSIKVMEKIGMERVKTFDHPDLKEDERLRRCVLYEINR